MASQQPPRFATSSIIGVGKHLDPVVFHDPLVAELGGARPIEASQLLFKPMPAESLSSAQLRLQEHPAMTKPVTTIYHHTTHGCTTLHNSRIERANVMHIIYTRRTQLKELDGSTWSFDLTYTSDGAARYTLTITKEGHLPVVKQGFIDFNGDSINLEEFPDELLPPTSPPQASAQDRSVCRDCSSGHGSPNQRSRCSNVADQRPGAAARRLPAGRLAGAEGREQPEDDDCGGESSYSGSLSCFSATGADDCGAWLFDFPASARGLSW